MRIIKLMLLVMCTALVSCNNNNTGHSTPIDSTNLNGTAPATYAPNDPANDQDTNKTNLNDTGTKANNVHHTGYDTDINRKNTSRGY